MARFERKRILAANAAFYAAFRGGDFAAMERLWSQREAVGLCHPNSRGVEGRAAVMRSWESILIEGEPPNIFPVEPMVIHCGAVAMVVCEEVLGSIRLIATNVFANEDGAWRLVRHQATRLPAASRNGGTRTGKGNRQAGDR